MKFFNEKYVHFIWNNELEGKKCFVADSIPMLIERVEMNDKSFFDKITHGSNGENYPFNQGADFQFAYYDPNYELKVAFESGKMLQYKRKGTEIWYDFSINTAISEYRFDDSVYDYRIKNNEEEKHYRPYKDTAELTAFNRNHMIKIKNDFAVYYIIGISKDRVLVGNEWLTMEELFEFYKYCDDTPIGVKE